MNNNSIRDPKALDKQYKTSENLDIRRALHAKYSTNKQGAASWLIENITFFDCCSILELGCGTGEIWEGRISEIGKGSRLVLSDLSEGMVEAAKQRFAGIESVRSERIDIQCIPYDDASFDIVIANSMLYHVPDLDRGISEVHRVLKPAGVFYASTTGEGGLPRYIDDTLKEFGLNTGVASSISFALQNGAALLRRYFNDVKRNDYVDSLNITDANDLAAYIFSMASLTPILQRIDRAGLVEFYEGKKNAQGVINIPKEYGVFMAQNKMGNQ